MPFTVSLSMTLGDFIDVLQHNQHNGHAALARRVTSQDLSPSHQHPSGSDPATNSRVRPAVHFPLELTPPSPINLPSIPRDGRGRPASLTNARARKIIAAACQGASVPGCAAAGGVTPNTLKSWLRRKDHPAFTLFQGHYADAVTYATLATLKVIADGVASDPKHAFEFLASRYAENWSMLLR